jgi:hypothetical protein
MASLGDPRVRDFVQVQGEAEEFKCNAVPGELVVRLRPVKVLANFDITG